MHQKLTVLLTGLLELNSLTYRLPKWVSHIN